MLSYLNSCFVVLIHIINAFTMQVEHMHFTKHMVAVKCTFASRVSVDAHIVAFFMHITKVQIFLCDGRWK